ncbi:MAG TPA: hypothetical protein VGP94_14960 [Tepidisphaeraceae bacterium]|nr:hypothetical protein [Tepidisphaeraceae bacterium]
MVDTDNRFCASDPMNCSSPSTANHPASLNYFSPAIRTPWPKEVSSLIAFVVGFIIGAASVSFIANSILKQNNSYLEADLSFGIDLIFEMFAACLAGGVIAISAGFFQARLRGVRFPGRVAMFLIGLSYAATALLPQVVDVATTAGPMDDGGNPASRGWGGTVGLATYVAVPILVILWIVARSLASCGKATTGDLE